MKKVLFIIGVLLTTISVAQPTNTNTENNNKMKVEIWSDIVCPWCYIGKRRFEEALSQFEHKDFIEVEYKSYQLDPSMETDTSISVTQYLSDKKGITIDHAEQMSDQVSAVAESVGLEYHLEKAIPINTLQAHGLLHYAKSVGKQAEMKERLMKAYFTETLNLDDTKTLVRLAGEVGLDETAAEKALVSNQYGKAVQKDIQEGVQLGLTGVPFFVLNRKYGISGAQESKTFLEYLTTAFADWRKNNPIEPLNIIEGKVCKPDGSCE